VAGALVMLGACWPNRDEAGSTAPLPSGAVAVPPEEAHAVQVPATIVVPGAGAPRTFADLVAQVDSAVVSIKTQQGLRGAGAVGSAFIYDPNGYILTNNHVIEGASEIIVVIDKTRELEAKVVGKDAPTDIAVLKVEAQALPYLQLGDSDAARVGDWVVAIGNPFKLSHTVSAGIISAKGRTGNDVQPHGDRTGYYSFIQTDASINPGNSGGPLLDMAGRVVGINHSIHAAANSIGFAIPINMVRELLPHLLKHGQVKRSAIGLTVASVLSDDMARLRLHAQSGALVRAVQPGGPADRAGLRPDDVILRFDGQEVPTPEKLRWAASLLGVGRAAELRVQRGSRTFDIKVTLGDLAQLEEPPPDFLRGTRP
jgi:serine protease Do